ncbi:hypothetical protein BDF14DRAFT_807598 [Spinellus fusiger]|nr:hypothetical protein BDF14DRAFT_807598 [Spinellus fusiger]
MQLITIHVFLGGCTYLQANTPLLSTCHQHYHHDAPSSPTAIPSTAIPTSLFELDDQNTPSVFSLANLLQQHPSSSPVQIGGLN